MTTTKTNTIQVFEYQTIRVGETINGVKLDQNTYQALALYQEKQATKYFSLVYNGVKFSHYVGVIQVGKTTIEILPKADKNVDGDAKKWQKVLLEMVRQCGLIKVESAGVGKVSLQVNHILDLYVERFLALTKELMNKGLPKKYVVDEKNRTAFKGRLNLPKHLRKNGHQPNRFYTKSNTFAYDHLFNQAIYEALRILEKINLNADLKRSTKALLTRLPKLSPRSITEQQFAQLFQIQKYQQHHDLLTLSRLLLFNFSPDIQSGRHHLIALLFDMNKLFEEYVFHQLRRLANSHIKVQRQLTKPFWQRRIIRPDLLIEIDGKRWVLDTKWKVLRNNSPSMDDLKQLYIYCDYFAADRGVLLYPQVFDVDNTAALPFQATDEGSSKYGQILFLDILAEDGRLNSRLGEELIDLLANTP